MPLPKITQVTAEEMAAGGRALARIDGKVIFVSGLAPGDRALIEITHEKSSYAEGRVKGILKPGPNRQEPECGHFPRCGGCQWLHLKVEARLAEKERQAKNQLRRFAGLDWHPAIGAGPDEKRTRVRLHLKNGHLGYYSQGSRRLEALNECPAMAPALAALLPALQKMAHYWEKDLPDARLVEELQLDLDGRGAITLLLRLAKGAVAAAQLLLERIPTTLPFKGAAVAHAGASGPLAQRGNLELAYVLPSARGPLTLGYSPFSFVQSSHPLNLKLVAAVLDWAGPPAAPNAPLVELYCGVGNFALPLAAAGYRVTGIESGELAINLLQRNAATAKLKIEARVGDAGNPGASGPLPQGALLLLDPPRTGAAGLAAAIKPSAPKRILYVSCDAATLGRDLQEFVEAGFKPGRARVLDLFPGTAHYETLVELLPV